MERQSEANEEKAIVIEKDYIINFANSVFYYFKEMVDGKLILELASPLAIKQLNVPEKLEIKEN